MTDTRAVVEQAIRDLIADNWELPIRASFRRGRIPAAERGPLDDPILWEHVTTPTCPAEWFVQLTTKPYEVCVSAAGRMFLGAHDVIGDVAVVDLPQTSPGVVDVQAVQGSAFDVALFAAVRAKAAVVAQMREAVKR